jgi:hypothetical protein
MDAIRGPPKTRRDIFPAHRVMRVVLFQDLYSFFDRLVPRVGAIIGGRSRRDERGCDRPNRRPRHGERRLAGVPGYLQLRWRAKAGDSVSLQRQGRLHIRAEGGSLRDVQELAGHASLSTTQRYIQGDSAALSICSVLSPDARATWSGSGAIAFVRAALSFQCIDHCRDRIAALAPEY